MNEHTRDTENNEQTDKSENTNTTDKKSTITHNQTKSTDKTLKSPKEDTETFHIAKNITARKNKIK